MIVSQIAFALGACGGLTRILMPSAVNTASKAPANWPARSLIRNLTEAARPGVHQDVAGCLGCPRAVMVRGEAGQVNAAGAVLDDDQRVDAPQEHGVHVDKVDREKAAGPARPGLLPGPAPAAPCGGHPRGTPELPHPGGGHSEA